MMPQEPTVADLLREGRARLGGAEGAREAELLVGHALGVDRAWLFAHAADRPATHQVDAACRLIEARANGRPVAYLVGRRGFWSLDLEVGADTLIPRAETERLVEAALARLDPADAVSIADLGTGSGAIALALAVERPRARVIATDASAAALAVARANAAALALANVAFREGDWCAAFAPDERFTMIVSNPPYLAEDDPHLDLGDLRFEPRQALASGADGLDAIRRIVDTAPAHLLPGAWLMLEHGMQQGAAVRELLAGAGLLEVETLLDLEGRDRVSLGRRP